ncbi:DUF2927 domain-containing protein [Moorena bouillonii]|uniref:DUF2927 domain-containing protein n=1 Tax=Moorena bouillonii PNG TaxID=568701 RepID=A0A1U7NCA3_9CYAN|nr:DUF2927 domain-containing protein [Moorena bouillonii]OLT63587.1 hypothetical protein BJP37_30730 [Moorena bouillonii PNG]
MRNFCLPIVKSVILSFLGFLIPSTYQTPTYGNNYELSSTQPTLQSIENKNYTQAQIDYFLEIALGSEYRSSNPTIKKWDKNVRIKVIGLPTPEDWQTLSTVIDEINTITQGSIQINFDDNNPNLKIYFVPEYEFRRYEPNYRPVNFGFFRTWWNNQVIYKSRIMISTTSITQKARSHLIREELTQSIGLMRDSYKYRNSVFFQGWTDTTEYAEIDQAVIEMLYRPEIRPGMTKAEVINVLNSLRFAR